MAVLDPNLELRLLGGSSSRARVDVSFAWTGTREELAALGIEARSLEREVAYASITVAQAGRLRERPEIGYVEMAGPTRRALIDSRKAVNAPPNPSGGALVGPTGKGVVVAIVDDGIDVFHRAFRNADGTTRILRLWRMGKKDASAKNPLPSPKDAAGIDQGGIEYTSAVLNQVLRRDPAANPSWRADLRSLAVTCKYGTMVAGIAAGNGWAIPAGGYGDYVGIAAEASIIFVALGTKGSTQGWERAFNYIHKVLDELGSKRPPCVINLSRNAFDGPHIAATALETRIGKFITDTDLSIVNSAGNGGRPTHHNHAQGALKDKETTDMKVELFKLATEKAFPVKTPIDLQLWYNYEQSDGTFDISVTPQGRTPVLIPLGQDIRDTKVMWSAVHRNAPQIGKMRTLTLRLPPALGTYTVTLKANGGPATGITWHCWLGAVAFHSHRVNLSPSSTASTLCVPVAAPGIISVGAYVSREATGPVLGGTGRPADFSSRGPTPDGIMPTLAAPGERITSAVPNLKFADPKSPDAKYNDDQGTSFAAPHVTGAVALMLQANAALKPDAISKRLRDKATKVTGDTADFAGAGRLNVLASMK